MGLLCKVALTLGIAATHAFAQSNQVSTCPVDGICYALSIPDATASSGTGDIFIQLSAPTSQQWVALAQGTSMTNSNMFIMYASANGNNVTVSTRRASTRTMPREVNDVDFELLAGSGISDGMMIANVRCGNCSSWPTGTMNFQTGNSQWVFAHRPGDAINSDDGDAAISRHSETGDIQFDVTQARTSATTNPFITESGTTTPSNNTSGSDTSTGGSSSLSGSSDSTDTYITAHGSLAGIAFVAVYPLGALFVRFANFPGALWVHAAIQGLAYALFIAAAGLGIYVARGGSYLDTYHAIIGLVLLGVIFFLPFLGYAHHSGYKKTQSRGIMSYLHIYIGRAAILLGMINGGFGLQLVGASRGAMIAYGVCAGIVGVVYIAGFVFGEARRARPRTTRPGSDEAKMSQSSG